VIIFGFEAVHGTAGYRRKNIANPTALLLSGLYVTTQQTENAAVIENALLYTLKARSKFGDKTKPSVNTTQFAEAIIGNFGKQPKTNRK
jgi:isocitrate dehydrogenase